MANQVGVKAVVTGNVKVIVNEYNNSLIIQATQADYDFLLDTIRQLDVLPRQCLIEAKVYAVTLTDDLTFGVTAALEKRGALGTNETATPATTATLGVGGALNIMTRTIIGAERQLEASITALRATTDVELVEAPRLLAMDGMQATFNVGAEVPVTTASFGDPIQSGSSTSFVNSIQFRPTGTTLLISPRISASGIITMDLAIEVSSSSSAGASGEEQNLTPTIDRSYVETSLIIRDGQTVAIAGIISDHASFNRNRIPLLGDIPILGYMFGSTTRQKSRKELIFLITPHVVPNLPTATELTLEFKRALRKAYGFMRDKEAQEQELIRKRREEENRELQQHQPEAPATPPNGANPEPEKQEKQGPSVLLRSSPPEVFAGNREKAA